MKTAPSDPEKPPDAVSRRAAAKSSSDVDSVGLPQNVIGVAREVVTVSWQQRQLRGPQEEKSRQHPARGMCSIRNWQEEGGGRKCVS